MVKSVPVPFAKVTVPAPECTTIPPLSTVTSSMLTAAVMVTVCPFLIVIEPSVDEGVDAAEPQVVPSVLDCQVDVLFQFPLVTDLYNVAVGTISPVLRIVAGPYPLNVIWAS